MLSYIIALTKALSDLTANVVQVAATLSCIKGTAAVFAAAAGAIACTDVEANLAAAKISASMDDCMEETEDE